MDGRRVTRKYEVVGRWVVFFISRMAIAMLVKEMMRVVAAMFEGVVRRL